MKALVLCAGLGTRLQPLSYTTPKPLMPIATRPALGYLLDDLAQAGVVNVGIVVDRIDGPIAAYASPAAFPSLHVRFLTQPEPLGLAHAVQAGRAFVGGEPFAVCLGDCFAPGGVAELLALHLRERPAATVALYPVTNPGRFGVAEPVGGKIRRFREKPPDPCGDLAITGLYAFEPGVFTVLERLAPSWRHEYELTDALQALVDLGLPVSTLVLSGHWQDIGRPEDLLAANAYWLRRQPARRDGTLRDCLTTGRVGVGEESRVEGSVLYGPIAIGRGCRIVNSHIGPFTSIGDGSQICNSEVGGSIVMEACHLNGVRGIDASVLGNGCRLASAGMGRPLRVRMVVADRSTLWLGEGEPPQPAVDGLVSPPDRIPPPDRTPPPD